MTSALPDQPPPCASPRTRRDPVEDNVTKRPRRDERQGHPHDAEASQARRPRPWPHQQRECQAGDKADGVDLRQVGARQSDRGQDADWPREATTQDADHEVRRGRCQRRHQRVVADGRPPKRELGRNATRAAARSAVVGRPVSSRPVIYTKPTAPSTESAVISRASRRGQYRVQVPTGVVEESRRKRDDQFAQRVVPHQDQAAFR